MDNMDNPDAQQHRNELKIAQAKQYSRVGESGGTFAANWDRIPAELADQLTPEQLGWIVDLLADAYTDGQRHPAYEYLQADGD